MSFVVRAVRRLLPIIIAVRTSFRFGTSKWEMRDEDFGAAALVARRPSALSFDFWRASLFLHQRRISINSLTVVPIRPRRTLSSWWIQAELHCLEEESLLLHWFSGAHALAGATRTHIHCQHSTNPTYIQRHRECTHRSTCSESEVWECFSTN